MKIGVIRIVSLILLSNVLLSVEAQVIPEVLDTGTMNQQLEYLQKNTNIYNNYRAVRNDMFLKLKSNVLENESQLKSEINQLNSELTSTKTKVDALQSQLASTQQSLEEAIETKNSFKLLGLNIDKVLYNTILWIVILALAVFTGVTFLLYKRSMITTNQCKKELEDVNGKFEEYKKQVREKQEKLVVAHHKEMMKLKKGMGV